MTILENTLLIGIDCAAQESNIGLARGQWNNGKVIVHEECMGKKDRSVCDTVAAWLRLASRALIAVDAPLGWPSKLGEILISHMAGEAVSREPHDMFRRYTDTIVKSQLGKQPFDVGANLIARAARTAVNLLQDIRTTTGQTIPLAWSHQIQDRFSAIEVYPAATMKSRGIAIQNYKKSDERRRQLVTELSPYIDFRRVFPDVVLRADRIDACVCLLSAADFLTGRALAPDDTARARKEGWIWFMQPDPDFRRLT